MSYPAKVMTPEEIRQKLVSLEPWFHCIELGGDIKTKSRSAASEPVDHPRETWEKIARCLPYDLTGMSVLDVGCNAGFYAIEAKRRGAQRVLGVDAQRHHVRQALFVRQVLGLDIEYRRMSVYDLSRRSVGQFDVTLVLGLIYHCKHLVLALERLYEVTKELLILETAILPEENSTRPAGELVGDPSVKLHPLVYAENLPEQKEHVFNWFLPGLDALKALLSNVGFNEVAVFDLKIDRAILLVRKTSSSLEGTVLSQINAELVMLEGPAVCSPGSSLRFRLLVKNSGSVRWTTHPEGNKRGAVYLGTHLLKEDGEELIWDYGRASLDGDLEPDQDAAVWIELRAPSSPGRYVIEFDMVLEHITWFEDLGVRTARQRILVR